MEINISSKYLKNKNNTNNKRNYKKYFKSLVYRSLITILLFLGCAIFIKSSFKNKEYIYQNVFNNNFIYTKFKNFYDKYLNGVIPFDNFIKDNNTNMVFKENLSYEEKNKYLDGVKLTVSENYLVPILKSGIVVYIGEKENYGNTVIIQGMDSVDIWYANLNNINVSLYDYVEEGNLLGDVSGNNLYLVYSKDGNFLNYEEYLN